MAVISWSVQIDYLKCTNAVITECETAWPLILAV